MGDNDRHDEIPADPLPALLAQIDQMLAVAPEVARAMRGVFDAFEGEGFTAAQSIYLTAVHFKDHPFPPP